MSTTFQTRVTGTALAGALILGILLPGCSSLGNTKEGALIGGAAGAAAGAAVGKATGSTARGAIIGAAIGGAAGAYIGSRMDDKAETLDERLPNATVERVGEGILVTFDGGLLFDFDSSRLRPEARDRLSQLVRSMSDMSNTQILVAGHTDSVGRAEYNEDLSLRRAQAAAEHLISAGIAAARIRTVGLGETEPVATNETEAGRQENRRVELAIYADEEMRRQARQRVGE